MNSEQWQMAWQLFNAARELPAGEQRAFVESASTDPEIAQRVFEELDALRNEEDAEDPEPAAVHIDRTGTQVGRYRVDRLLGRGGMGEVYAAWDADLGRQVALKFLLPGSIRDAAAVKRFVREAKAASALNHPNIVTIHEVIDSISGLAIAMELVEGEPLSGLRGSKHGWREVAQIGSQAAAALAAFDQQGIVHRDIKPENLMLRPDGIVKVLDFGLAQGFGGKGTPAFQSSIAGLPGGTLRYMSPEQLRNEPLTGASDVYSLGLVLYELIANRHPFESEYAWETAYAIHTRDAQPLSAANRETPAWLGELIVSMLNRDAALRPSAHEVASRLVYERREAEQSKTARARAKNWKWILAAVATTALAAAAWSFHDLLPRWKPRAVEFTRYPGDEDMPSLSPDGQSVAFAWNGPNQDNFDLYVRAIGSTEIKRITTSPLDDFSPAWSPDGKTIAFLRKPRNSGFAGIFLVPPNGGEERKIADISLDRFDATASLAWTPDGKWLVSPSRESGQEPVGLFRVSPMDGTKLRLTRPPPGQSDLAPAIAPGGRMMAFTRSISESVYSIYLLALSSGVMAAGEPQSVPTFPNLRVGSPQWTPDGKELLFAANPTVGMAIWRMRAPASGEVSHLPRREMYAQRSFRIRIGPPAAAAHRLMYATEVQQRNIWRVPLGNPGGLAQPQMVGATNENNAGARISPDGLRLAFESLRTGSTEIWVANIDGTKPRQLTNFGGPVTGSPAWSPDGQQIAFDSRAEGRPHIYVVPAQGGRSERVTEALDENYLPEWSHDGRWIYFCSSRSGTVEVWRKPEAGGTAEQLTREGGWAPTESPDGTALYYQRRRLPSGWSLRRLTLQTRTDEEILPAVTERAFEVAADGIYYVPEESQNGRYTIQFYDLRTRVSRLVTPIQKPMTRRLALSPDGSFLYYSQLDRWGLDLMLVENFH